MSGCWMSHGAGCLRVLDVLGAGCLMVLDVSGCWMSRVLDVWVLDVQMLDVQVLDVCESNYVTWKNFYKLLRRATYKKY